MAVDFEKIGLKCGIEIHQQLATEVKLFCNCSAAMRDKEPVLEFERELRPVAGETGEVDVAAQFEAYHNKTFKYKVFKNESCAVELDEEPPHPMNQEALETALRIALMLKCDIPEEIQVMRKTVLDGSNTSGFQRTAVVGIDGHIETSFGKVGITSVAIEEDACQIIEKRGNTVLYGLNRLGVPLVEIGTNPDIKTPEQAREAAQMIGMILRSTGKVRRGIGTIRQDVNVSIRGGSRVEIKGVQDLRMIPKLIDNEIRRQQDIISKKKEVSKDVRKAMPDGSTRFLRPLPGAARMYPETDIPPIIISGKYESKLRKGLPKLISDKAKELESKGLSPDLAKNIAGDDFRLKLFEEMSKLGNIKPAFLANTIISYRKDIKKRYPKSDPGRIGKPHLEQAFVALDSGKISKDNVIEILGDVAQGKPMDIGSRGGFGEAEVREIVRKVIDGNPQAMETPRPDRALMGLVMKEVRGKADGGLVMKVLMEEINKHS